MPTQISCSKISTKFLLLSFKPLHIKRSFKTYTQSCTCVTTTNIKFDSYDQLYLMIKWQYRVDLTMMAFSFQHLMSQSWWACNEEMVNIIIKWDRYSYQHQNVTLLFKPFLQVTQYIKFSLHFLNHR